MGERHLALADRRLERAGEIIDPQRAVGRLVLLGLRHRGAACCGLAPPSAAQSCGTASSGVAGSSRSTGGRAS